MLARLTSFVGSLVLALGLVFVGYQLGVRQGGGNLPPEFAALDEVYDEISTEAVEPPPDDVLVDGAIEGMLDALDDTYAEYYDPEEYAALTQQLDGTFVGIGVVLEETEVGLTVQTVLPGSPAEEAGLEPGEEIVTVDGRDVSDTPSELVVEDVRGEEGTSVVLGLRNGSDGPREVTIVRARLEVPNVESRMLAGDVGYVALRQFTQDAGDEVRGAVSDLLDDGVRALVLDLRGNPGGYLPAAVDVTGVFLSDAEVVSVGRAPDEAQEYRTDGDALAPDIPLAVLVDAGSASASEIVAGAVQDHDRGTVVGTTTFGKGTVQTITDLAEERGLKFTTARYFTPSGDSIDGVGVAPDRVVERGEGNDDMQLEAARTALSEQLAAAPAGL